ncbi:MAG: hypothetical protein ACRC62_28085 [Microcoleus sp.]
MTDCPPMGHRSHLLMCATIKPRQNPIGDSLLVRALTKCDFQMFLKPAG